MAPGSGTGLHMDLLLTGCPCVAVSLYVAVSVYLCVVRVSCTCTSRMLSSYKLGYSFVRWCAGFRGLWRAFISAHQTGFRAIAHRLQRTLVSATPLPSIFIHQMLKCFFEKRSVKWYQLQKRLKRILLSLKEETFAQKTVTHIVVELDIGWCSDFLQCSSLSTSLRMHSCI